MMNSLDDVACQPDRYKAVIKLEPARNGVCGIISSN